MLNIVLTAVLLVFVVVIAKTLLDFQRKAKEIIAQFKAFAIPPKEGEPSQASMLLDNASKVIGHAVAVEFKTTLMGKASAASRQEAGIMADIAHDAVEAQNPMLTGILDSIPSLKKRLGKNPQLIGALLSQFGGQLFNKKPADNHEESKSGFAAKRGKF